MLLIISYVAWLNILIVFLHIYLELFLSKFFHKTILLDLFSRSFSNDFILLNLFFCWTSLWYLGTFFVLLLVFSVIIKSKIINEIFLFKSTTFVIVLLILFNEFYHDNIFNNYMYLFNEGINTLLKNSVNKIHPLLLYSSVLIFFKPVICLTHLRSCKSLQNFPVYICNVIRFIKLSYILIISALYLGSWW